MTQHLIGDTGGSGDTGSVEAIPGAVATLRQTFESGRTLPVEWRQHQLDALLRMLDQSGDELIAALAREMGKPAVEAHVTDVGYAVSDIKHTRRHLAAWMRPRKAKLRVRDRPGTGRIVPEPLGVSLIIAPWNYPVQLTLCPLAAALAAGNAAVVKPSELVPETSALMARLLREHLDPEAVAVFEGGPEVATALLEQRFDHIFFTGSTAVGRIVAQAAAKHLTPTVLELGGKSPVIVGPEVNLEVAAKRIAWGKGVNAGQTCIAPDYVLVHRSHRDELVDRLGAAFEEFYGPDPAGSPDLARIVNERHAERLSGLLATHGGTVERGGVLDRASRKLPPTLVVDPDPSSPLMREEIFGPILPVLAVDDVTEAIAFVNERPKPLALYVFSSDDAVAQQVIERTSSGGVCLNHVMLQIAPPEMPFGGVGDAGRGRYHGQAGFDALSNLKPVFKRPFRPDLPLIYPPYTKRKASILTRL